MLATSTSQRLTSLAGAAALALLLAACHGPQAPGFALGEASFRQAGFAFADPPEATAVTAALETRAAVLTSVDGWSWRGRVPRGARLHLGVQVLPAAWRVIESLEVEVVLVDGGRRRVMARTTRTASAERAAPRWLDLEVDLRRHSGREVALEFRPRVAGLPAEHRRSAFVAWAPVTLLGRPDRPPERPNILFILVDTLRHDHLTAYGYGRPTSPEIDRWLARRGAVVEEAYAQAPWTLPSAASYLTGRQPGALPGAGGLGIPDGVPTLAERLAELGYATAAFSGNPTVHAGIGFARGFDTFGSTGDDVEAMFLHADAINERALGWLAAQQYRQPFFLYLHYIDPHDPYENPDIVDNVSRFESRRYRGKLGGRFVHGVYTGKLQLESPAEDVAHLTALYDSEVRYVDGRIGELLAAIDAAVLAETLVVFTSDHGEELHDHGGWKHGQSLYEEQVHVPLIVRWDGRVAAGRRLAGSVRLLDLAPTLVAAAGGAPDAAWDGVDLLPALTGAAPLPRRPAFTEHLTSGPLRAAAILDRRKLVLFNRRTPFAPADSLQEHLWRLDLERFARVELYDLAADPGERRNLAGDAPAALQEAIHRQLERRLPGLRVMLAGAPGGARLRGRLRFARPAASWSSYFLDEGDQVALAGREARFELGGDSLTKGFLLEGSPGALEELEATLDGEPLPAAALRLGAGAAHAGGAVAESAFAALDWPVRGEGPRLHVWRPAGPRAASPAVPDPETLRRLRALGYVQ